LISKHIIKKEVEKPAGASYLISIDMRGHLDAGETITSITTTTSDAGITISNVVASTAARTIDDDLVPIGQAIQALAVGGTAGTAYNVLIKYTTSSTPAQVRLVGFKIKVVADAA